MSKIILLTDILETKIRKEKELEFYQKELDKLNQKMFFLRKEIEITNLCIEIIEKETVVDLKALANSKVPLIGKKEDE